MTARAAAPTYTTTRDTTSAEGEDAAIYALNADKILGYWVTDPSYLQYNKHPFEIREIAVYEPPKFSQRIISQNGVFTLHPEPNKPYISLGISKDIIERKACIEIKSTLYNLGIHRASLFPDLDGYASALNWVYATYADNPKFPIDSKWGPRP